MKQLKFGVDVNVGDICVYMSSDKKRYIILVDREGHCKSYIIPGGYFSNLGGSCNTGEWVEATPEEIQWMKDCVEAGELVKKPKLVSHEIY
jgi:hypothetical protein